ncbi:MAG: polyketide cyclase [Acidimicrobiales bacterium]|nr:polyketide cyclase [Acidimicrobiales bacterium]
MNHFTPNSALDLVIERTIFVSPERVWAAWTEPELLVQWFTPAPWRTAAVDIDLRPGGRCVTTMESPEGVQYPNVGCYLQIEPNQLLVYTSVMTDDFRPFAPVNGAGLGFTARIEIEGAPDGGTHYRAIAMHANEADHDQHEAMGFADGWGAALDQLVTLMTGPNRL